MDIPATLLLAWIPNRIHPMPPLQAIESGLLGQASCQHGCATGLHYPCRLADYPGIHRLAG
jgi:hypothetical protein